MIISSQFHSTLAANISFRQFPGEIYSLEFSLFYINDVHSLEYIVIYFVVNYFLKSSKVTPENIENDVCSYEIDRKT